MLIPLRKRCARATCVPIVILDTLRPTPSCPLDAFRQYIRRRVKNLPVRIVRFPEGTGTAAVITIGKEAET